MSEKTKKVRELEESIDSLIISSKSLADNSAQLGAKTLEELDLQNESLARSEENLELTDYITRKSKRILRGMTFTGALMNMFVSDVSNAEVNSSQETAPKERVEAKETTRTGSNDQVSQASDEIPEISKAMDVLFEMSLDMSNALKQQHESLDRIENLSNKVNDSLLEVTLMASKLTMSKTKTVYLGRYEFMDIESSMYLSVDNKQLRLTHFHNQSVHFDCFCRNENIMALQSSKTLQFIKVTPFGSIEVSGEYFGRYEQLYFDFLSGRPGGILIINQNWSYGGWLKRSTSSDDDTLVNSTTSSVRDQESMLIFVPKLATVN